MADVTIDVPPWPAPIPELPGDTSSVRGFAADLLATSSALDDLASFAGSVRTSDYWNGAAAEAYGAAASGSADDADAKFLVLSKVSGQVEDFADEMDAFETRRLGLLDRRTTLESRRIDLTTDINGTTDATDVQVEALRERSRQLRTSFDVLYEDHAALLEEEDAAGQAMIAAFRIADTPDEVRDAGDTMSDPAGTAMNLPGAPGDDSSPEQVHAWWTTLSPDQRRAAMAANPEVIGNTNGIPTDARDEANRISLDLDLDELETREDSGDTLSFAEKRQLERARAAHDAITDVTNRQEGLEAAHLTAIGHSYGSTTLGNGATDHDIPVDDIVLVGSPGAGHAPTTRLTSASTRTGVWTGANSRDPVSGLARNGWVGTGLGLDPADEGFGANRFQAEDIDRETGEGVVYNHNQYYKTDSESLFNMGQIVAGNDTQVVGAEHRSDPIWRWMDDPEKDRSPTQLPTGDVQ